MGGETRLHKIEKVDMPHCEAAVERIVNQNQIVAAELSSRFEHQQVPVLPLPLPLQHGSCGADRQCDRDLFLFFSSMRPRLVSFFFVNATETCFPRKLFKA